MGSISLSLRQLLLYKAYFVNSFKKNSQLVATLTALWTRTPTRSKEGDRSSFVLLWWEDLAGSKGFLDFPAKFLCQTGWILWLNGKLGIVRRPFRFLDPRSLWDRLKLEWRQNYNWWNKQQTWWFQQGHTILNQNLLKVNVSAGIL